MSIKEKTRRIIFEADTPAGKLFDVLLIISIILSVIAVMMESVVSIRLKYVVELHRIEWFFTILFTIEYILRITTIGRPVLYARSFFGVVDLLAILPTYISLFIPGSQYLVVVRILRVLRVFRILKFVQYMRASGVLLEAMRASRQKITVFLFAVLALVIIMGSLMYIIEGESNGFTSIPLSVYWAIVTLTTVGYGDLSPQTPLGQFLASIIMIVGYGIIAVPTGIMTVELSKSAKRQFKMRSCPHCSVEGHDRDAEFCKYCGGNL